jgi:hypothetical protein
MGLLDDAIREHLDLKRRRGADPDEVARLESEALGPVRREPAAADPTVPAAAEDAPHVLAPDERHEPPHGDPLREAAPETHDTADRAGGAGEDDSATPLAESPRPATGPARGGAEPEPEPEDLLNQPTTEFRVEDHHDEDDAHAAPVGGGDGAPAAEDVLEETPEFLQETPEHDRLWFEQRPPRDFDFDG